ncbi:MAG TPA: carboxypeptidase-like regulatory domain-containing protein [Vicinamibacterales bacterium]|nr:carboxypeptidase-like regulatory domain-containing protein [Vicinamibacterales bacterium]
MRTRSFLAVIAIAAAAVGCSPSPSPTPIQTGPTVSALTITGPATIAPGATAQFTASARMSDGSTLDYTAKVTWRSNSVPIVTITSSGQATGQAAGETQVQAVLPTLRASANVMVIPAGTWRLTGNVTESGYPVSKATVAVTSGVGAGLSAVTDFNGAYRIYGVAGPIEVTVTKDGYTPVVQAAIIEAMGVLDIPVVQVNARNLAGTYALTIATGSTCSVYGPEVPLRDDLRQRHYVATITETGPVFRVDLSGANFVVKDGLGGGFSGRVEPNQITFSLGDGYYTPYPDIVEGLDDGSYLNIVGSGTLTISGTDILGTLSGAFYQSKTFFWLGGWPASACGSNNIQFAFAKGAALSRIRR